MTDYSRDRLGPNDEDRLPWLEPVEEEPEESGIGAGKLIAALVAALVVIGLIIGGVFWMRSRSAGAASGDGSLIAAPDTYYKERPADTADESDGDEIVYSASKGNEFASEIDTSAIAEAPVNVDRPAQGPAPAPAPQIAAAKPAAPKPAAATVAPAASAPAKPVKQAEVKQVEVKPAKVTPPPSAAPAPASGGSMVQLGAFSSQAKANSAWKTLSSRFGFLSGLTQSVVSVQSGDKTLYRLRASGGNAGDVCARLRTAGESCSVIG